MTRILHEASACSLHVLREGWVRDARDIVAVVNAWNVFGGRAANICEPLVAALLS